jgi:hypothetical protein
LVVPSTIYYKQWQQLCSDHHTLCYSSQSWAAFFIQFTTLKYLSIIHSLQILHVSFNKRMIQNIFMTVFQKIIFYIFRTSVSITIYILWFIDWNRKEGKSFLLLLCEKYVFLNFQNVLQYQSVILGLTE